MRLLQAYTDLEGWGQYRFYYHGLALRRSGQEVGFMVRPEIGDYDMVPIKLGYGIYVYSAARDEMAPLAIRALGEVGKIGVYEGGDHCHAMPRNHPFSPLWHGNRKDMRFVGEKFVREAEAVTASTHEPTERYSHLDLFVLPVPPSIDTADPAWGARNFSDDGIEMIEWAEATDQLDDFLIEVSSLERLSGNHLHIKVAIAGTRELLTVLENISDHQKKICPPVSLQVYPKMPAQFDIGIDPLAKSVTNRHKFSIKCHRCFCLGIPVNISASYKYAGAIVESENGFANEDPREWYCKLNYLVEKGETWWRIGATASEWTIFHMKIEAASFLEAVYSALLDMKSQGIPVVARAE